MATISCSDCGAERRSVPKNTLYCKPCRLLRDIAYWVAHQKTCRTCRAVFSPIARHDNACSACDPGIHGQEVDCVLCKRRNLRLIPGIPVCAGCLRAPARRIALFDALKKGQRQRQEANSATTQA